jgi:hypothetical protein
VRYHAQSQLTRLLSRFRLCWRSPTGFSNTGFLLKETSNARPNCHQSSPPPPVALPRETILSGPAWGNLTAEQQETILLALSRLLAQRLPGPTSNKEVTNDAE